MRTKRTFACALLTAAALAVNVPAMAGGPLIVIPTPDGPRPARWEGTVNVYTDLGTLGVVDNALAKQLVANSLQRMDFRPDVELSRASGGHHRRPRPRRHHRRKRRQRHRRRQRRRAARDLRCRRHRADRFHRRWLRRAGHRDARVPRARRLDAHRRGLGDHHRARARASKRSCTGAPLSGVITHEFGHAIGLAHTQTNGLYFRNQPIEAWGLPAGAEKRRAGPVRVERDDLSERGTGRDHVSVHRSVSDEVRPTTAPAWRRSTSPTTRRRLSSLYPRTAIASAPARSPGAWSRRTA